MECPINIPPLLNSVSCVIPHFQLDCLITHLCPSVSSVYWSMHLESSQLFIGHRWDVQWTSHPYWTLAVLCHSILPVGLIDNALVSECVINTLAHALRIVPAVHWTSMGCPINIPPLLNTACPVSFHTSSWNDWYCALNCVQVCCQYTGPLRIVPAVHWTSIECPINLPPSLNSVSCVIPHFQLDWLITHLCPSKSSVFWPT